MKALLNDYIVKYLVILKFASFKRLESFVPIKLHDKNSILKNYYLDLILLKEIGKLNDRIVVRRGHIYVKYNKLGIRYNPLTEAHYALIFYQMSKYDLFLKMVDNLIERGTFLRVNGKEVALWYYPFPFPPRAYRPQWVSGMAQGVIASLFARAFYLTGNDYYRKMCVKTIEGMLLPIEQGGALHRDEHGCLWIEEYPEEKPLSHVLNGFIYAILGLYDAYIITSDERYLKFFLYFIKTLKRHLRDYDAFFWSKYDVFYIASLSYHFLNTTLIYILFKLTKDETLKYYVLRWLKGFKLIIPLVLVICYFTFTPLIVRKKK